MRRATSTGWRRLEREILSCERCPRLRRHCADVARRKRRAYRDETYWGRPVEGYGDRDATILLLGLAPGAHGANRTGRLFTGDRSGEWLWAALHRAGLSDRAASVARGDGMRLDGAFVSNVCRCAPPANRPAVAEIERCREYLDREFELLGRLRVVVALGGVAWSAMVRRARRIAPDAVPVPQPRFGHGAECRLPLRPDGTALALVGSYHPSQQNTQTGRLTRAMLDRVLRRARKLSATQTLHKGVSA